MAMMGVRGRERRARRFELNRTAPTLTAISDTVWRSSWPGGGGGGSGGGGGGGYRFPCLTVEPLGHWPRASQGRQSIVLAGLGGDNDKSREEAYLSPSLYSI